MRCCEVLFAWWYKTVVTRQQNMLEALNVLNSVTFSWLSDKNERLYVKYFILHRKQTWIEDQNDTFRHTFVLMRWCSVLRSLILMSTTKWCQLAVHQRFKSSAGTSQNKAFKLRKASSAHKLKMPSWANFTKEESKHSSVLPPTAGLQTQDSMQLTGSRLQQRDYQIMPSILSEINNWLIIGILTTKDKIKT